MATRTCKCCGGEMTSKRSRRGWITIHTATGAGCPQHGGAFQSSSRKMDADELAEYRMTAEYAAEVRYVPMESCNDDL